MVMTNESSHTETTDMTHLSVFCRRPRQSIERTLALLDLKNSVTSLSRLVLGAKQPVISHSNSQPRSSLALRIQWKHTLTEPSNYQLTSLWSIIQRLYRKYRIYSVII